MRKIRRNRLTLVGLVLMMGLAGPALAQKKPEAEYLCDDDECEAAPIGEAGRGEPKPADAKMLPQRPVDALRSDKTDTLNVTFLGYDFALGISGRINQALLYGDNGEQSDKFLVDNSNSSSRIMVRAEAVLNDRILLGGRMKLPIILNSSVGTGFDQGGIRLSFGEFGEREFDAYIAHSDYGRFFFGYGSTASDGSAVTDLSGTQVIATSAVRDFAGGLAFDQDGPRIRDVFDNFDGLLDNYRLRYDTPRFNNFAVGASVTIDGDADMAIRWENRLDDIRLAAAASLIRWHDGVEQAAVSASGLWRSGFSAAATLSAQHRNDRTAYLIYGKVGYFAGALPIGPTAFALDVALNRNVRADGDRAFSSGLFAVQTFDRDDILRGIDVYAGARFHHLESRFRTHHRLIAAMTGVRLRF